MIQTLGTVLLTAGNSTVNVNNVGGNTLQIGGLSRIAGGTVNFVGAGTVQLQSNTGLPAAGVALPYATIGGTVLATYSGASAPFTIGAITPTNVGGGTLTGTLGDVKLTANATVAAGAVVNSIDLNGFSLLAGTNALTVSSGAVLNKVFATTGTATINSPRSFGTAEGIIDTNTGAITTIAGSGKITGSGGLTVTGGGTLNLNTANTYTGATSLDSGTLEPRQ